jgi:hypothetical protein
MMEEEPAYKMMMFLVKIRQLEESNMLHLKTVVVHVIQSFLELMPPSS